MHTETKVYLMIKHAGLSMFTLTFCLLEVQKELIPCFDKHRK